jgi:hypothetical protein
MSDYLPDSPYLAERYCPGCEPDRDEMKEILEVRWCEAHSPNREGKADEAVGPVGFMNGSDESGGDSNRRFCEMFHRPS